MISPIRIFLGILVSASLVRAGNRTRRCVDDDAEALRLGGVPSCEIGFSHYGCSEDALQGGQLLGILLTGAAMMREQCPCTCHGAAVPPAPQGCVDDNTRLRAAIPALSGCAGTIGTFVNQVTCDDVGPGLGRVSYPFGRTIGSLIREHCCGCGGGGPAPPPPPPCDCGQRGPPTQAPPPTHLLPTFSPTGNSPSEQCHRWIESDTQDVTWQDEVEGTFPCPCNESDVRGNASFHAQSRVWQWVDGVAIGHFQPGADECYRSDPTAGGHGQQCCYSDRQLLTTGPGAGTMDRVSAWVSWARNHHEEHLPWVLCGSAAGWEEYALARPISNHLSCPAHGFADACAEWVRRELQDTAWQVQVEEAHQCPCNEGDIRRDRLFHAESGWLRRTFGHGLNIYHPGADECYRSNPTAAGHAQQCCYNTSLLLTSGAGAGTMDKVSSHHWLSTVLSGHQAADVDPWNFCGGAEGWATYTQARPISNGLECDAWAVDASATASSGFTAAAALDSALPRVQFRFASTTCNAETLVSHEVSVATAVADVPQAELDASTISLANIVRVTSGCGSVLVSLVVVDRGTADALSEHFKDGMTVYVDGSPVASTPPVVLHVGGSDDESKGWFRAMDRVSAWVSWARNVVLIALGCVCAAFCGVGVVLWNRDKKSGRSAFVRPAGAQGGPDNQPNTASHHAADRALDQHSDRADHPDLPDHPDLDSGTDGQPGEVDEISIHVQKGATERGSPIILVTCVQD